MEKERGFHNTKIFQANEIDFDIIPLRLDDGKLCNKQTSSDGFSQHTSLAALLLAASTVF